jgi:hypothetical protein
VLVVVVAVCCMAVAIVVIVDVVIVLDGLMAATIAVDVIVVAVNPMLGFHTHPYRLLTPQRRPVRRVTKLGVGHSIE